MILLVSGLFLLTGIILLAISIYLRQDAKQKYTDYRPCTGTIVDLRVSTVGTNFDDYTTETISPVIEYFVWGEKYTTVGKYYSTSMKVGDTAELLYDPRNPATAVMTEALRFAPIITGVLGGAFVLLGISFVLVKLLGVL